MKQIITALSIALLATQSIAQPTATSDARIKYINAYKGVAIDEMDRSGIPASIKLGQAILESNAGQSAMATEANNHFGIKCGNDWNGKTYYVEDDDKDASGNIIKSCFRKYKKAEVSYRDHSEFLRDPKKFNRYGFLFNLDRQDYKSWAYGLKSAGYATSDTYADNLIRVIEDYKLYEFDTPGGGGGGKKDDLVVNRRKINKVNNVKMVLAKEGETISEIARAYRLRIENVVCYNDCFYQSTDKLKANTRIYIAKKKKKWSGRASHHYVTEGQTMYEISQLYGVLITKLWEKNGLTANQEPAVGQKVRLKGSRKKGETVKIRPKNDNTPKPPVTPTKNETEPTKVAPGDDVPFEIGPDQVQDKTEPQKDVKPTPTKVVTTGEDIPAYDPDGKPTPKPKPDPKPQPKPDPTGVFHTVAKGDTLYNLSKKYGTTPEKLRKLNDMTDNNIKIGQKLRVQ